MARTQEETIFGFHSEETDLDGNLMPWTWSDDGNVLPASHRADFGPPSPLVKGQYYYEGLEASPMLQTPAPLNRDLVCPLKEDLSPVVESPTSMERRGRRPQILTVAQAKNRKAQKKFREKQKVTQTRISRKRFFTYSNLVRRLEASYSPFCKNALLRTLRFERTHSAS